MGAIEGDIVAEGLAFPRAPCGLDGELLVTEIMGGTIARLAADGGVERVGHHGGRAQRRHGSTAPAGCT